MHFKYTLYIPVNIADQDGKPTHTTDWATIDWLEKELVKITGFTKTITTGGWRNENGDLIKETTAVYEMICKNCWDDVIVQYLNVYKTVFNQKTVLYTKQDIQEVKYV